MTKTQNIFEQHLRLTASYTSKEAADHKEPEIDLGHCTDMLHSNLLHMTTLFSILVNDYNKTGYLVYCFYK